MKLIFRLNLIALFQAKNNLKKAIAHDKLAALKGALETYHQAAIALEAYREQKPIELALLADDEIEKAKQLQQALSDEQEKFVTNPHFPKYVSFLSF